MTVNKGLNSRVLVIDDEESVRDSFRTVLAPVTRDDVGLQDAASALFDTAPPVRNRASLKFEVDLASNGKEGLWMVETSLQKGLPYAAIFCDMRMPGWDGLETIERIRALDQRAEVVFVTAYSDHSIETVVERAGGNVGYFVKPFLTDEVKQLATKLVLDWNKARELEDLMRTLTALRGDERGIAEVLSHLLEQICDWLDTESAALIRLVDGSPQFYLGVGALNEAKTVSTFLDEAAESSRDGRMRQLPDGTILLPIQAFGYAIALSHGTKVTPDRRFLLQVFLEYAALAIRNGEAQQRLAERERMAAVGQAISYILHDLRGPIGVAKMFAQLLRSGKIINTADHMLGRIETQSQRALDLLTDALDFCRDRVNVTPGQRKLAAALESALEALRMEFEQRSVAFEVDIPAELEARVDPDRFWRVIWNLCRNGADAAAATALPRVTLRAQHASEGVMIHIEDNGPGIPSELVESMFVPFGSSTKEDGHGFGLAIVRQIVIAHQGTVRYERDGDISRFSVFLPDKPL